MLHSVEGDVRRIQKYIRQQQRMGASETGVVSDSMIATPNVKGRGTEVKSSSIQVEVVLALFFTLLRRPFGALIYSVGGRSISLTPHGDSNLSKIARPNPGADSAARPQRKDPWDSPMNLLAPALQHRSPSPPVPQHTQKRSTQRMPVRRQTDSRQTKRPQLHKTAVFRCIAPNGVAYRTSANVSDKMLRRYAVRPVVIDASELSVQTATVSDFEPVVFRCGIATDLARSTAIWSWQQNRRCAVVVDRLI